MNINDYLRFKIRDIESYKYSNEEGTGKFEWLFNNIKNKKITIVVDNGVLLAIDYDDPDITDINEYKSAKLRFISRYKIKTELLYAYIEVAVKVLSQDLNVRDIYEDDNVLLVYVDKPKYFKLDKSNYNISEIENNNGVEDVEDIPQTSESTDSCEYHEACDEVEDEECVDENDAVTWDYALSHCTTNSLYVIEMDHTKDLPVRIIISSDHKLSRNEIKDMLRNRFKRYIKKNSDLGINRLLYCDLYVYEIYDIKWSNKKLKVKENRNEKN